MLEDNNVDDILEATRYQVDLVPIPGSWFYLDDDYEDYYLEPESEL